MNLKDTLNLLKTNFPMRADLVNRETIRVKSGKRVRYTKKYNGKMPRESHLSSMTGFPVPLEMCTGQRL
jgi:hypothetical protein